LLLGFGLLWTAMFGWPRLNDLSDPAITYPGWTPYPLAVGVALVALGLALVIATRRRSDGT
jgi:hypothetical protein